MANRTFVVGVGMTKFEKPGSRDWDYPDMGREAGQKALADAGISYDLIEEAYVGYCYGDSTTGQRALYELGLTGIPAVNVNNNCSTGSSALYLARRAVLSGLADCTLALGFEKMKKGSLGSNFEDRTNPMDKHVMDMIERRGFAPAPPAAQVFGNAGKEYMEKYGVDAEAFAKIGEKNHRHSVNNPYSQFQDQYSLEDIKNAPMVYDPLTKLQCCPTSDGGGAAIIASERFVNEHDLWDKAVEIAGQAMTTDFENTFDGSDMIDRRLPHDQGRRPQGLRGVGPRPGGRAGHRAARLLQRQRAHHLRGPRALQGGQGRRPHPLRRRHLRRPVGRQPVGRAHLQGPPARRHRPGPVRRADLADPRRRRQAPGRQGHRRPPAQPRPRRRRRRHHLQGGGRLTSGPGRAGRPGAAGPELELRAGAARAGVFPALGGRLGRLEVDGRALLRGPDDGEDLRWSSWGAFPLLPWSNRIPGGRFRFEGRDLEVPINREEDGTAIHGLVAWEPWEVVTSSADAAELTVEVSVGPFHIGGRQTFTLTPTHLDLELEVTNLGDERVPAGLGLHPWFVDSPVAVPAGERWPGEPMPTGPARPITPDEDLHRLRRAPTMDRCYTGLEGSSAEVAGIRLHWSRAVTSVIVFTGVEGWVCVEPVTMANDGFRLADEGVPGSGVVALDPSGSLAVTYRFDWS